MIAGALPTAGRLENEAAAGFRLRRAVSADGAAVHALKQSLRFGRAGGAGGFLLGSSEGSYAELARAGLVLLLETPARSLAGFAVAFPHEILRGSDLWGRRHRITWFDGAPPFDVSARVAYFDQLAASASSAGRALIPALAMSSLLELVATGHEHVLATVVREPVHNTAALRLLHTIGARRVGQLDETYPGFGRLLSDLYHLDVRDTGERRWETTLLGRRLHRLATALTSGVRGRPQL
jgi:hypothetical protein